MAICWCVFDMNRAMTLVVGFLLIGATLVSGSGIIYLTNSAGSSVVLSVTPAIVDTSIGGIFAVTVNISNIRDLGKWEMTINWNASVIDLDQTSGDAVAEGPFLRSANAPTKFQFDPYMTGSGVLSGVSCSILQAKGASGTGSILQMRFRAIDVGTTSITIINAKLYDFMGRIMIPPPSIDSGEVNVNSASAAHDVRIAAFDCPPSVVAGELVLLNATVENLGTSDENWIRVELGVNGIPCNSTITSVPANSQIQTRFNWTASPVGTLNLAVSVDLMSEDANLTNNVAWKLVTVVAASYDLAILLDTMSPGRITLGENVWLNASVLNLGSMNESNVEASIYVDGEPKHHEVIPSLVAGDSHQIGYLWIPDTAKTFNITASVISTLFDSNTSNNFDSRNVTVIPSSGRASILVVSDDGGFYSRDGTGLPSFASALANYSYDVWLESANGTIKSETLARYGLVIWTCGDYAQWVINPREELALLSYFKGGGNVLLEGEKVASDLISRNQQLLLDEMLHIKWDKLAVPTSGIESVYPHPLTQGLTSAKWIRAPAYYPDGVEATEGGFAVMNYAGTNFSAITVVDGSETGTGSVIYMSFSVSTLPEANRTLLIGNAVQWFGRFGVSVILGEVIRSPARSVSFVYGRLQGSNGSSFDTVAGGMLYALCKNEQIQEFADALNASTPDEKLICAFGSPFNNEMIRNMNASGVLPIIICQDSNDQNHYQLRNNTSNALLYDFEIGSGNSSLFIIQAFKKDGRTYLVVCGFDWQGTWASGMKLSRVLCRNLRDYSGSYYVFEWKNSNESSIPVEADYQMLQTLSTIH